jgi:hypothetical protein
MTYGPHHALFQQFVIERREVALDVVNMGRPTLNVLIFTVFFRRIIADRNRGQKRTKFPTDRDSEQSSEELPPCSFFGAL